MWRYTLFITIAVLTIVGIIVLMNKNKVQNNNSNFTQNKITQKSDIRYIAIGDSYTIGEGVLEDDRYPNLLTKHLREEGVDIELVANPSVTGYTVEDAIRYELPIVESSNPNFVTVLIGANDVFGRDTEAFRRNLQILLNGIQAKLPERDKILVITIPDFSVTPYAKTFGYTRSEIQSEITKFNTVIKDEADKRELKIVDLYPLTGRLENDPRMLVSDGLHPSAKQFILWEKEIFPVAYNMLK